MNKEKTSVSGETAVSKKQNFKRLKYGSMSAVVIALVVAIVVVINLMCGLVTKRYPLKIDLTPDKRYELSDETIDVLKNLSGDVEITVTTTRDTFLTMANYFNQMYLQQYGMNIQMPYDIIPEILDKYSMYAEQGSGKISIKYVDINKDPDVVTRYKDYYNGEISENNIVVFSGERVKVIDSNEVMNMIKAAQGSTQQMPVMAFAGESVITSAIMSVTDSHPISVAVIKTMNGNSLCNANFESIVTSVQTFLEKNGYDCSEVDIASDDLTAYDMAVLPMPESDFSVDIIDKLGDFLYNGGKYQKNMLYIPSLTTIDVPNITEFLADWKIQVEPAVILDNNMVQTPIKALGVVDGSPVMSIADEDSVGKLSNQNLPIVAPYTRALTILSKNNESVATAVIKSSDTSYLEAISGKTSVSSEKASYNAVVVSKKETANGMDVSTSHLMVIGSAFFADNGVIQNSNTYNNASVFLNMVNTMTGKENNVVIPEKSIQQTNIAPDSGQLKAIKIIVVFAIPILVALAGSVVLLRRRNR